MRFEDIMLVRVIVDGKELTGDIGTKVEVDRHSDGREIMIRVTTPALGRKNLEAHWYGRA